MFWAEIWKISEFLSENFQFLEVKFSIYLNRRVFVMLQFLANLPETLQVFHLWSEDIRALLKESWFYFHFFHIFILEMFRAAILWTCVGGRNLVSAIPPTVFSRSFWKFTGVLILIGSFTWLSFCVCFFFFFFFFFFFCLFLFCFFRNPENICSTFFF